MKLVWHIARKDLRHIAVPAGCWLLFCAIGAIWLARASLPEASAHANVLVATLDELTGFASAWWLLELLIAYIFIGSLILEDKLGGTTEFWVTRPIAGLRLYAGKIVAAFLLFVIAPVLALGLVWLVCGFTTADFLSAAGQWSLCCMAVVMAAIAVASLVRSLGQFVLVSLILSTGLAIAVASSPSGWELERSFGEVTRTAVLSISVFGILTTYRFWLRRSAVGWVLLMVGLVGIGVFYDEQSPRYGSDIAAFVGGQPTTEASADIELIAWRGAGAGATRAVLSAPAAAIPGQFLAPFYATIALQRNDGVMQAIDLRPAELWGAEAVLRVLGQTSAGPTQWELYPHFANRPRESSSAGTPHASGEVVVAVVHATRLSEVPLRVALRPTTSIPSVRVAAMIEQEDGSSRVVLEERERDTVLPIFSFGDAERNARTMQRRDHYALLVPGYPPCVVPHREIRRVSLNGIGLMATEITIPAELSGAHREAALKPDARIVKIRFTREHLMRQPLRSDTVKIGPEVWQ